jgi:hypothetical protein
MRTMNTAMISLTVCLTGLAFAGPASKLPSGLEFQPNEGWQVKVTEQGGAMLQAPGQDANNEAYIAGIFTEFHSLEDSGRIPEYIEKYFPALAQVRIAAPPTPFTATGGGRGMMHAYEARNGFIPVRIHVYMVDTHGRGIAGLFAIGRRDIILNRGFAILAMATTFQVPAAAPAAASPARPASTPLVTAWTQRLSDKKLVQFSGYSSGGGSGGYNSEKKLYLAANGTYAFRSSSSVSIYVPGATGSSAGQHADEGRWRIVEERGQPVLELISGKGDSERIVLSANGTQTFLNGRRWYVVGINE